MGVGQGHSSGGGDKVSLNVESEWRTLGNLPDGSLGPGLGVWHLSSLPSALGWGAGWGSSGNTERSQPLKPSSKS